MKKEKEKNERKTFKYRKKGDKNILPGSGNRK